VGNDTTEPEFASAAMDPDCAAGQVLAFPGELTDCRPNEESLTVFLVLVTDDSRAAEGILKGVYLESVCDDGLPYGQYRRQLIDGDEVEVVIYADEVDTPPSDSAFPMDSLLSAVDWVDENERVHTEWCSEVSIMTVNEWDAIIKDL
jgi:hypothetical protein